MSDKKKEQDLIIAMICMVKKNEPFSAINIKEKKNVIIGIVFIFI